MIQPRHISGAGESVQAALGSLARERRPGSLGVRRGSDGNALGEAAAGVRTVEVDPREGNGETRTPARDADRSVQRTSAATAAR